MLLAFSQDEKVALMGYIFGYYRPNRRWRIKEMRRYSPMRSDTMWKYIHKWETANGL